MSISMLIRSAGQPQRELPVATNAIFKDYWAPQSRRLGLDRILQFDYGAEVPTEEVPDIIGQLEVLKESLSGEGAPEMPDDVAGYMRERIGFLLAELRKLDLSQVIEFSIG